MGLRPMVASRCTAMGRTAHGRICPVGPLGLLGPPRHPLNAAPLAGLRQEVYMYVRIMPFGIPFQGKLIDLVGILNESVSKTRYARARAE